MPVPNILDRLITEGKAIPAKRDLRDLSPRKPPGALSVSEALEEPASRTPVVVGTCFRLLCAS